MPAVAKTRTWPVQDELTPPATLLRAYELQGVDAVRKEFNSMCWGDMYDCQQTLEAILAQVKAERKRRGE